jgi:hypothetical protein
MTLEEIFTLLHFSVWFLLQKGMIVTKLFELHFGEIVPGSSYMFVIETWQAGIINNFCISVV